MNVQSVALDVTKQPQISPVLYLGQGDKNGTTLEAAIYDDGTALTLTGKSARFCMRTPNGAGYYECDGTVSGNTATFLIDETYAATVDGITDVAYVEILEGSTVICSTNRFRVVVLQNATEDTDPNGAYTNGVQRFLDDAQDTLDDAVTQAQSDVSDAVDGADAATARAIAAAEAAEGIVLQDVPTMSKTVKGGATLGSGLRVDDGALSLGDLVQSGSGAEVVTDGCAIFSIEGEGWSEQQTTVGKNLVNVENITPSTTNKTLILIDFGEDKQFDAITFSFTANGLTADNFGSAALIDMLQNDGTHHYFTGTHFELVSIPGGNNGRKSRTIADVTFRRLLLFAYANSYIHFTAGSIDDIQLELGSTATSYEPYTGGAPSPSPDYPQEIEVCRGRNLLPGNTDSVTLATGGAFYPFTKVDLPEGTYTVRFDTALRTGAWQLCANNTDSSSGQTIIATVNFATARQATFTTTQSFQYVKLYSNTAGTFENIQLELGTAPSPYVPYGHVGLEVRDSQDALVSCTPIPLPAKGFAASLPDGTADALTVDSAGRWEWVNEISDVVVDNTLIDNTYQDTGVYTKTNTLDSILDNAAGYCSHFVVGSNVSNMICKIGASNYRIYFTKFWGVIGATTLDEVKAWFASNPVTVLYPKTTPTTEHGYINLPALPSGATVSIPELEQIGVSWFVDGCEPIVEHAANMAKRETEENESIEDALAELAARVAALES